MASIHSKNFYLLFLQVSTYSPIFVKSPKGNLGLVFKERSPSPGGT